MMSLVKEKSRIRSGGCKTPNPLHSTPITDRFYDEPHQHLLLSRSLSQDALDSYHHEDMTIDELAHCLRNGESPSFLSQSEERTEVKKNTSNALKVPKGSKGRKPKTLDSAFDNIPHCETSKCSTPEKEDPECLMCSSVKSKLVAAKDQIRKLKKELAEAHANFDKLEMFSYKLSQDLKLKEEDYTSQISLMTAKIDDLTSKFSLAEKNYRQLKQKTSKSDGKERKRSSLKNKESLSLTKEYELKLCDLEKRINHIESSVQRETSPGVPECSPNALESSDTASSSTDVSSEKSLGFFSRLQSLASRTQKVDEQLTADESPKEPEIRLEIRCPEEQSLLEEACNDQWATSFDKNIKMLSEFLDDYPSNMSDFKTAFFEKLSQILQWLQNSLDNICQEENLSTCESKEKTSLNQTVLSALKLSSDTTYLTEPERIHLTFLKMAEVVKFLEKINSVESFNSLIQYDLTECAFKVVTKTLCLAFAEYENREISSMCEIIATIPHVRYFCPIFTKLQPSSSTDTLAQSIQSRLCELNDQRSSIFNSLVEAKKSRYDSLWNILADIPVQDTNVSKPPKISSIEQYVTFLATDVFRLAELQLPQMQPSFFLKQEAEIIHTWSENLCNELNESHDLFLAELKDNCPMVHESSVSVHDLSDSVRKDIAWRISELSFLCITQTVLKSLTNKFSENFEIMKSPSTPPALSSSLNKQDMNSDYFNCRQCTTICRLLSDAATEVVCWEDFLYKYKFYNIRSEQIPSKNTENRETASPCANCDACSPTSDLNKLKDACNNVACSECEHWVKKLCTAEKQHELEKQAIDFKYSQELQLLEEALIKNSEVHDDEMLLKERELESTTIQLHRLKNEYEAQIQSLKNIYEKQLQFKPEDVDQDIIRNTYKAEIEDLKDMFRNGLSAIQSSHQRITEEMEKKHEEDICILKAEKQKALELEAKATVTALEAIKKSHEQQLIKETTTIKEDLMKKFQNGEHYETYFCKYGSDLESLKAEILNITEMYSSKCLENLALEEKVNSLKLQLEGANNELCNLLSKNKEIDLHLSAL